MEIREKIVGLFPLYFRIFLTLRLGFSMLCTKPEADHVWSIEEIVSLLDLGNSRGVTA
jgi:hypothetical protein